MEKVEFETALTRAGFGTYNYLLLAFTLLSALTSVFVSSSTSFYIPIAGCDLGMTNFDKGLCQIASYLGMIVSGFMWGPTSDRYGRQKLLAVGFFSDFIFSIGAGISTNMWFFFVMKVCSGFMINGPFSIFPAYLSEMFPQSKRQWAVLSCGLFTAIGNILLPALAILVIPLNLNLSLGFGLNLSSWRVYLIMCAVPSLLCGFGSLFLMESPKFLWEKGEDEKALKVLRKIFHYNRPKNGETYNVKALTAARLFIGSPQNQNVMTKISTGISRVFEPLLKRPYSQRTLIALPIMFIADAAMNPVRLWLPQILSVIESQLVNVNTMSDEKLCHYLSTPGTNGSNLCINITMKPHLYIDMIYFNLVTTGAQIIFLFSVKYVGKKFVLVFSLVVPALLIALLPIIPLNYFVMVASFFISVGSLFYWALVGCLVEMFPTRMKATIVGWPSLVGRLGVLSSNMIFSVVMYSMCDYIFYIFSAALAISGVVMLFFNVKPFEESSEQKTVATTHTETEGYL